MTSALADSITGSMFPTCYFTSCAAVSKPVRLFAPLPPTVSPVAAASPLQPVARSLLRPVRLPPASTPLWDLCIPPDRSVPPVACQSVRLPKPPDCLSLPASVSISSFENGSMFPARYGSEACCSSNLLEPPSLCPLPDLPSRNLALLWCGFHQFFSDCLSSL